MAATITPLTVGDLIRTLSIYDPDTPLIYEKREKGKDKAIAVLGLSFYASGEVYEIPPNVEPPNFYDWEEEMKVYLCRGPHCERPY